VANNWLFPGYTGENFLGPALNLSIPAAYSFFKNRLSAFTDLGVKGYKIDRGEEGEMPGILKRSTYSVEKADLASPRTKHPNDPF